MRPIDGVALAAAVLAVFVFLSASGAFRRGRRARGIGALLLGASLFLTGLGAGAVSVGTEGYRALAADTMTLAATVTAEPLGRDSVRARLTYPDGITRTFRVAGDRVRIGVRILRWKAGRPLVGRPAEYELARLTGGFGSTRGGADSTALDIGASRPVDLFELAERFGPVSSVVDTASAEVELPAAAGAEFRVEVSPSGARAERVR